MRMQTSKWARTILASAICLLGISAQAEDFRFVHMTDCHVYDSTNWAGGSGDKDGYFFGKAIEEIKNMATKPAFIAITGDSVDYGGGVLGAGNLGSQKNWAKLKSKLYTYNNRLYARYSGGVYSIPVYITPGNHDYRGIPEAAWASDPQVFDAEIDAFMPQTDPGGRLTGYYHRLGKRNFAVTPNANTICIFLDSGYDAGYDLYPPRGSGITREQVDWLFNLLNLPYDNKLIFMHHPTRNGQGKSCSGGLFPAFQPEDGAISNYLYDFYAASCWGSADAVFAGHAHQDVIVDYNPGIWGIDWTTKYVQTGSSPHGSYRIVKVTGSTIDIGAPAMFTYNKCFGTPRTMYNGGDQNVTGYDDNIWRGKLFGATTHGSGAAVPKGTITKVSVYSNEAGRSVRVGVSRDPGSIELYSADVPTAVGWSTVSVNWPWSDTTLFIYKKGGDGSVSYSATTPYDSWYTWLGITWDQDNWRRGYKLEITEW